MTNEQYEETRFLLDEAITRWLKYNGLTDDEIVEQDYSALDDELHYILEHAKEQRGE
jgi:hypothetical protein